MPSSVLISLKRHIKGDIILYPISETKYRRRIYSQNSKFKAICINKIAYHILQRQQTKSDYVFPLKRRHPSVIRKTIAKIRKLTGIKDFNFHQLRHTTSTLISSSVSLSSAKTILGHADLKTTMRYTHPGIEEQRKGVAKIGEIFSELVPLSN
jgi:integrase